MISIAASDIRITKRPALAPAGPNQAGNGVSFSLAQEIEAVGSVTFAGRAGDSGAGWSVGFLQAEWVETNWGVYRGDTVADGSVFVQRARPPARPKQACLDADSPTDLFYGLPSDEQIVPAGSIGRRFRPSPPCPPAPRFR